MNSEQLLPRARTTGMVTQDLSDEVLVYNLNTHEAHCLNQTAAAVWKYCDGKTPVPEIADLLQKDFGQLSDEGLVWQAIDRLSKADLLEQRTSTPKGTSRLGRREALRRLSVGSALAVPVVMSILAPTALAGCTFAPGSISNGQACCVSSNCASGCCGVVAGNICQSTTPSFRAPGSNCGNHSQCCSNSCVSGTCQ